MEFAHRAFINDPSDVLAQIIMSLSLFLFSFFFFSDATNVQPWLMIEKGRENLLIPMLCCCSNQRRRKTEIVFLPISLHFFFFFVCRHDDDTYGSNRWLGGVHDRKKMLDEFSFLVCSSNYSLLVLLLKNERTIDRLIHKGISFSGWHWWVWE